MTPGGRLALVAVSAAMLCGCGTDRELTERSLREARQVWTRAGIKDYDLEWTTTGLRTAHYRVQVRGGRVEHIGSVLPDGREIVVHPAEASFYSVDGLFATMEEELDQSHADQPFGQAPGSAAVLRFDPDPRLGYPRRYRRDVVGATKGLAIDVVKFAPSVGS